MVDAYVKNTLDDGTVLSTTAEVCVPMVYSGVNYDDCTDEDYGWCATSTDDSGNYVTWAYCGIGNSNDDQCVPFLLTTDNLVQNCTSADTSGW